jgi:hypothetical protein
LGDADVPAVQNMLDVGMFAFRSSAQFEEFKIEK